MSVNGGATWPAVVDGEVRADGRADVLLLGGGFQHGEGLFETLPLAGGRPLFLAQHLRRLEDGAEALDLLPAPSEAAWRGDLRLLAGATGSGDLAARLFLFKDGDRVRRAAAATGLPEDAARPAVVGLVDPALDGPRPLARFKTLNYLVPRRAHRLGAGRGCDEVLFSLPDGTLLEGTRSTLFIVRKGVIVTPPLSLPILPGVTREILLAEARTAGIPVQEEPFKLEELLRADEAFLSASLRGVRAIRTAAGRPMAAAPGPVTLRLRDLFEARALAER